MDTNLEFKVSYKYDDTPIVQVTNPISFDPYILKRFIKHRKIWLDEDDNLFEEV